MKKIGSSNGFSLIELMIAVAVIAILTAIAYPSYQESIQKSRRADAKAALVQLAQYMERFYTLYGCYNWDPTNACLNTTVLVPLPFTQSPTDSAAKYYNLSLNPNPPGQNAFTLQAVPIATTDQANDKCGTLSLTNTGVKSSSIGTNCW